MGILRVVELVIVCFFLYFAANLVRYIFFKGSGGGKLFGLSDRWIKNDERGKK